MTKCIQLHFTGKKYRWVYIEKNIKLTNYEKSKEQIKLLKYLLRITMHKHYYAR